MEKEIYKRIIVYRNYFLLKRPPWPMAENSSALQWSQADVLGWREMGWGFGSMWPLGNISRFSLSLARGRYSVWCLVQQNALDSVHTERRRKRNATETVMLYHRQKQKDWSFKVKTEREGEEAQPKREELLVYSSYKSEPTQRNQEVWRSICLSPHPTAPTYCAWKPRSHIGHVISELI